MRPGGDDSAAPPKWRRPRTAGLALSPSVLHAGDHFQARPRRHPRRTSYGLQLIALDVARPCSEIFHLAYDGSGRTWEREPSSGSYLGLEPMMEGPVIPAIVPPVASPGRYEVCTSENECGALTVAP